MTKNKNKETNKKTDKITTDVKNVFNLKIHSAYGTGDHFTTYGILLIATSYIYIYPLYINLGALQHILVATCHHYANS